MTHENTQKICLKLRDLLQETMAGEGILGITMTSDGTDEFVVVHWEDKYEQKICVTGDSGIALISNVLKRM